MITYDSDEIYENDEVQITYTLQRRSDGQTVDATAVTFVLKRGNDPAQSFVVGLAPEAVRTGQGVYTFRGRLKAGTYYGEVVASGEYPDARRFGPFTVHPSLVAPQ